LARATATYRFDPATYEFLRAKLLHLIIRGENVIGHFGRRGHVTGTLKGHVLTATLRDSRRDGHITATFAEDFTSFEGDYLTTLYEQPYQYPCSGQRLCRSAKRR